MYLNKGEKNMRARKRKEDWHEITGSSPNIIGLSFSLSLSLSLILFLFLVTLSSLTADPTVSVFLYLGTSTRNRGDIARRRGEREGTY